MIGVRCVIGLGLGLGLGLGAARADPGVLPEGGAAATLEGTANLHPSNAGKPWLWAWAPDLWFGATDRLTIGVEHAGQELGRFDPDYRGGAIEATWRANAWVSPRARAMIRGLDPDKPAVTLGAYLHAARGRFEVAADPYLQLGLANTDRGNRSALWIPVTLTAHVSRVAIDLRTGWNSELAVATDGGWHVPAWIGARVAVGSEISLGAAVAFYSAAGPQNDGNARALFVQLAWATPTRP